MKSVSKKFNMTTRSTRSRQNNKNLESKKEPPNAPATRPSRTKNKNSESKDSERTASPERRASKRLKKDDEVVPASAPAAVTRKTRSSLSQSSDKEPAVKKSKPAPEPSPLVQSKEAPKMTPEDEDDDMMLLDINQQMGEDLEKQNTSLSNKEEADPDMVEQLLIAEEEKRKIDAREDLLKSPKSRSGPTPVVHKLRI